MVIEGASIKRKCIFQTFESLLPTTKTWNNNIHINPLILLTHLTALIIFKCDTAANFCYELEPVALFKDGMMKKPPKYFLRNYLLSTAESITPKDHDVCVIDGATLLFKFH